MKKMLACFALLVLVITCGSIEAHAELYPSCGVVVEIDYTNNIITVEDFNGNLWGYEGIEDFFIGDIVAMIFDDMRSEIIYDDCILSIRYCGYCDSMQFFTR